MKPTSITLRRTFPAGYECSLWDDGVARFDGTSGIRQGAWQTFIPPAWFAQAAKLVRHLGAPRNESESFDVLLVSQGDEGLFTHGGMWDHQEPPFWTLATLVDGIISNALWSPLDATGTEDFSIWAAGIPMTFQAQDVSATALALSEGLLVLAGSHASSQVSGSLDSGYTNLRDEIIASGGFESDGDRFKLSRHLLFKAPSSASSVLVGSNTNGTGAWKDAMGRSWRQLGF